MNVKEIIFKKHIKHTMMMMIKLYSFFVLIQIQRLQKSYNIMQQQILYNMYCNGNQLRLTILHHCTILVLIFQKQRYLVYIVFVH